MNTDSTCLDALARWLEGGPPPDARVAAVLSPEALRARHWNGDPEGACWRPLALREAVAGNARLDWGTAATPFGEAVLAFDDRGLWHLSFTGPGRPADALLRRHLPAARFSARPAPRAAAHWVERAFGDAAGPLPVCLHGTPFRLRVWHALARVPSGRVCDYGTLAALAGRPGAARAVGGAMAANPVAWLIPCHRIVRADGRLGHYQSGSARKAWMLAREAGVAWCDAGGR